MNEKQVKSLVFDVVLTAALNAMSAAIPFLRLPVIKTIFNFVATKIANAIYEQLAMYVKFTLIDIKTAEQKNEYDKAVDALRLAKPEDVNLAKEEFKKTLSNLIGIRR